MDFKGNLKMKKKIVISGPILSRSGYGEMARFAMRSLMKKEDLVDLFLLPSNWGNTGNLFDANEETNLINELIVKTQVLLQQTNNQPNFDVSIQVTIPNEWKKLAAYNIGYTAGIETTNISPAWLQPSLQMDKIIVISEHAKKGFTNTVFMDQNANAGRGVKYSVTTPIEVCHFPVRDFKEVPLELNLKDDFNFLTVCQWSPRKNLEQLIHSFLAEFKDEQVGLVLKINTANDSILDRDDTEKKLNSVLAAYPDKKCSVYLLHGHMSEAEMLALYKHPKIKAIVSSTHGEGFGFPLFEAAYSSLPIIATDWSGHLDFLTVKEEDGAEKKLFAKVDYELKPIAQEHVWQGVLEPGTQWAYPQANSLKNRMREVYKDHGRFKSWSKKLNTWVREEFEENKVYSKFSNLVVEQFDVENWLKDMNIEENVFEHD